MMNDLLENIQRIENKLKSLKKDVDIYKDVDWKSLDKGKKADLLENYLNFAERLKTILFNEIETVIASKTANSINKLNVNFSEKSDCLTNESNITD